MTDVQHHPRLRRAFSGRRGAVRLLAATILMVLLVLWYLDERATDPEPGEAFDVTGALAGEDAAEGFARVTGPEPLRFPEDHLPHPEYRHEWWYVTGNVEDDSGRHFGFQVTLFRFNVAPDMPERQSALATDQLWMAHLAVTDTETGEFHHRERFVRGAAGLAGSRANPFRIHAEDWVMAGEGESMMPLTLDFTGDDLGVSMRVEPSKPLVLQGETGYSRKGPLPGNASRYYSYTRLAAEGRIDIADRHYAVSGDAWMDREWGTSTLSEDQVGWDWFSVQLDDGRDIMFYQLRREDGTIDPLSKGLLVDADGGSRVLDLDDVELEARRHWQSPRGGEYPVAWRMRIPDEGLDLELDAVVDHQELDGAFRYWEGAVRVSGREGPDGHGYAELTGYTR